MILSGSRKSCRGMKRINVLEMSEKYANKGTKKYFRVYAEIDKAVRPEQ